MDLLDEVIRRHSDNSEGTNPFPALRITPVLPEPGDGKGPTVLHGNGIGLLCPHSFDGTPLKEAFNGNDAATLGVGAPKVGSLTTLSALPLIGLRPPVGSSHPCGIRPTIGRWSDYTSMGVIPCNYLHGFRRLQLLARNPAPHVGPRTTTNDVSVPVAPSQRWPGGFKRVRRRWWSG
jgi:hypothetical protein